MKSRAAALFAALAVQGSVAPVLAAAPPRTPAEIEALADLAYVLGRAHALHRLCVGPADNVWRERMERMTTLEGPDPALRGRLTERFNAGYVSAAATFTACNAASAADERATAERGRELAQKLASGTAQLSP